MNKQRTETTMTAIEDHWDDVVVPAERYELELVPALFEPWARELVELADPQPGERVLDVACGTGIVARTAAPRVAPAGTVTGLDVNQDMLAVARRVAAARGVIITWTRASAVDTGLPACAFDVAFCQQGLQFVPDRAAAVAELHRVLAPGGRVAVSVWCTPDSPGYAPLPAAFRRHLPNPQEAVGFLRAVFGLGDPGELRALLTDAGFRDVRVSRRSGTVRYPSAEAWVRAFLDAAPLPSLAGVDPAVFDRIVGDVAEELHPFSDGAGLAFPIGANVALARRGP